MEVEVGKLELMFQKADSDLDYIQYRLEYEIKTNYPDSAGKVICKRNIFLTEYFIKRFSDSISNSRV